MKKLLISSIVSFAAAVSVQAAVTVIHEYKLGEAGSLGTNNIPQDNVGSANFTNAIAGASASVGTVGVFAPGSTAYIDTSSATNTGWYGADFSGVPLDNFAIGAFARASAINSGEVFTTDGPGGFKIGMDTNGWAASKHGTAWISPDGGVVGSFTADQWVHLALVRQSGTTTFYIDGVANGSYGGAPTNGSSHIGVAPGGGSFFDGHIDEARVVTFTASDSTLDILNTLQGIPEPSSTVLLGLGGLALTLLRRK